MRYRLGLRCPRLVRKLGISCFRRLSLFYVAPNILYLYTIVYLGTPIRLFVFIHNTLIVLHALYFVRRKMWIPPPLRKFSTGSKVDKNHVQSSTKKGSDKKYKVKTNNIMLIRSFAVCALYNVIIFFQISSRQSAKSPKQSLWPKTNRTAKNRTTNSNCRRPWNPFLSRFW